MLILKMRAAIAFEILVASSIARSLYVLMRAMPRRARR